MKPFLFLGILTVLLSGCGADQPKAATQPATGPAVVHSLSVKLRKGTEHTVIGGMWHLPQNVHRSFFFSGKLDGKATLKDPVFKHELPILCVDADCRDFSFTLVEPETSTRILMNAHVFEVTEKRTKSDSLLPVSATDYRVHWQNLINGEIDLPASNVVNVKGPGTNYFSANIVGVLTSQFHLYWPSEGAPRVAYDYATNDSGLLGAGHSDGVLQMRRSEAIATLPGGSITLTVK